MNINTMKKVVAFCVSLSVLAAVGGVVFIFLHTVSTSQDIDIEISPRYDDPSAGTTMPVDISVSNGTDSTINDVNMLVTLRGALVSAENEGSERIEKEIGSISGGEVVSREVNILPIATQEGAGTVSVLVSYSLGSVSFESQSEQSIEIESSAIDVGVEAPDQILGSVPFDMVVSYSNESGFDIPNAVLRADYPPSFQFISSNPSPTSLNNRWDIGGLTADTEGQIRIRGSLENNQEPSELGFSFMREIFDNSYPVKNHTSILHTAEPPVDLEITRRGQSAAGGTLRYTVSYDNRSGVALRNNNIELSLSGDMIDLDSIESTGNSIISGNTLIWGADNNPELELLEPTDEGSFTVTLELRDSFPIERLSDKNFSVRASAVFESPSVPYYLDADQTTVTANETTDIEGEAGISSQAFFRDPDSGLVNEGSVPPRVGESTQYSVHWEVTSYSTDITDVRVESELPDNVSWVGESQSNIESAPRYDEDSGTVVWEIDEVRASTGVLTQSAEGIFKVEIIPTEDMIGSPQIILGPTTLTATDAFTGSELGDEDSPLSTFLQDDPTIDAEEGRVVGADEIEQE